MSDTPTWAKPKATANSETDKTKVKKVKGKSPSKSPHKLGMLQVADMVHTPGRLSLE